MIWFGEDVVVLVLFVISVIFWISVFSGKVGGYLCSGRLDRKSLFNVFIVGFRSTEDGW